MRKATSMGSTVINSAKNKKSRSPITACLFFTCPFSGVLKFSEDSYKLFQTRPSRFLAIKAIRFAARKTHKATDTPKIRQKKPLISHPWKEFSAINMRHYERNGPKQLWQMSQTLKKSANIAEQRMAPSLRALVLIHQYRKAEQRIAPSLRGAQRWSNL